MIATVPGRGTLAEHGIEVQRPDPLASDDVPALHPRARPRRRDPCRRWPARGRHRGPHGPLAQGQVHRPRARLRGANLVGRRERRDLGGVVRGASREGGRGARQPATSTSSTRSPAPTRRIGSACGSSPRAPGTRSSRRRSSSIPRPTSSSRCRSTRSCCTRPPVSADPEEDGTRSETFVVLHPSRGEVLIGGTYYAGEIKKSIFTLLNDRLPLEGVFPMHCSANLGDDGTVAVFFGLSGTGKTTLSADPERHLIGDDEHGWADDGIFNFEGGCYAKVIRLSMEAEPAIYATTRAFGTVLENVVVDEHGVLDLDDDSKTENTRAAYKLEQIANALPAKRAGHPQLGDLPHRGRVRDPSADRAADARSGAVLVPLRLHRQARGHRDRRHRAAADVLGRASARRSCRSRRRSTRGMLGETARPARRDRLAREHRLDRGAVRRGPPDADRRDAGAAARGSLRRPCRRRVPHGSSSSASRFPSRFRGVQTSLLDPRLTWADPTAYDDEGGGARADVPHELRAFRGRLDRRRGRRAARLNDPQFLPFVHEDVAIRSEWGPARLPLSSRDSSSSSSPAVRLPATSAPQAPAPYGFARSFHGQAGPARVDNAALGAIAWRGGPITSSSGEVVHVFVSDALPAETPEKWAEFIAGLTHGPELARLTSNIATLAEVQRLCGARALGCYSGDELVVARRADRRRHDARGGRASRVRPPRRVPSRQHSVECNRLGPETLGERRHRVPAGHGPRGVPRRRRIQLREQSRRGLGRGLPADGRAQGGDHDRHLADHVSKLLPGRGRPRRRRT